MMEDEPLAKKMKVTEQQPVVQMIGNEEVFAAQQQSSDSISSFPGYDH